MMKKQVTRTISEKKLAQLGPDYEIEDILEANKIKKHSKMQLKICYSMQSESQAVKERKKVKNNG